MLVAGARAAVAAARLVGALAERQGEAAQPPPSEAGLAEPPRFARYRCPGKALAYLEDLFVFVGFLALMVSDQRITANLGGWADLAPLQALLAVAEAAARTAAKRPRLEAALAALEAAGWGSRGHTAEAESPGAGADNRAAAWEIVLDSAADIVLPAMDALLAVPLPGGAAGAGAMLERASRLAASLLKACESGAVLAGDLGGRGEVVVGLIMQTSDLGSALYEALLPAQRGEREWGMLVSLYLAGNRLSPACARAARWVRSPTRCSRPSRSWRCAPTIRWQRRPAARSAASDAGTSRSRCCSHERPPRAPAPR